MGSDSNLNVLLSFAEWLSFSDDCAVADWGVGLLVFGWFAVLAGRDVL